MLSYDSPMNVNAKGPSSPASLSTGRQSVPSSPKMTRLPSAAPNGLASNGNAARTKLSNDHHGSLGHHVWLVTGPAGSGKSTVAKYLANTLHLPYVEGDEFHPKANVEKMSNGIPLTDADRWDWLTALREEAIRQLEAGNDGAVVTCSALKRKYRDVIRVAPYFSPDLHLHFIYLHAPEDVLLKRVMSRKNHYMGANMVHSQFDILEPPTADETDVVSVDVSRPTEVVEAEALDKVLKAMDECASQQ